MYRLKSAFLIFLLSTISTLALASKYNMPVGVTPISREIYDLHMAIFWICVGIGVVVFSIMGYSIVKHRKSRGAEPAKFKSDLKVEIVWAVIPFLILVSMAIPATRVLINMKDTEKAEINIKITGYQWKWKYEYLDEGIEFYSNMSTPMEQIKGKEKKGEWYLLEVDKPLVLPVNRKVRFLVTSNDVIHSWWVPDLGVKRDAIPGFIHESWTKIEEPGIYRGQCAELCGVNHAFMPIVVEAKSEEEYEKWLISQRSETQKKVAVKKNQKKQTLSKENLMSLGKKVYNTHCVVCHKEDGKGMPPIYPSMVGDEITVGPVEKHIKVVLYGIPGTAMQPFKSQLNDLEIAAVVTYERNSWGNDDKSKYGSDAGGVVQPAQVSSLK